MTQLQINQLRALPRKVRAEIISQLADSLAEPDREDYDTVNEWDADLTQMLAQMSRDMDTGKAKTLTHQDVFGERF